MSDASGGLPFVHCGLCTQVEGVRLYHDQALNKEPGGGYTPWHCDAYYWPVQSDKIVTAWVPLQVTTPPSSQTAAALPSESADLRMFVPTVYIHPATQAVLLILLAC